MSPDASSIVDSSLPRLLSLQRRAFDADRMPSVAERRHRMDRLLAVLLSNADSLCAAINADFGQRSPAATLGTDLLGPLPDVLYIRRKLASWSRPRRIRPGWHSLAGIRVRVEPKPLGVVGIMAPWNFPVTLAMQPTFAALAAGNRVMVKVSEVTLRTSELLANIVADTFAPEEIAVVLGDAAVAAEFAALPFDHLFFTGSPGVGKHVQRSAADNLVPVTLELGGKNPAVVGRCVDIAVAARRVAAGRMTNGGQLCLCPDYVFVPRESLNAFIDAAEEALRLTWPTVAANPQYPWIVNAANYNRVTELLHDAESRGAQVRTLRPPGEPASTAQNRWMAPSLVWDLTEDMRISQEEVFGPVLSVLTYDRLDEVLEYINARPSPLAAYWFGRDGQDFKQFAARVRCGGLTRNDFAVHALPNGIPFGGLGASGSGYYHGKAGFDTFSHLRASASTSLRFSIMGFVSPPFTARTESAMRRAVQIMGTIAVRRAGRRCAASARPAPSPTYANFLGAR